MFLKFFNPLLCLQNLFHETTFFSQKFRCCLAPFNYNKFYCIVVLLLSCFLCFSSLGLKKTSQYPHDQSMVCPELILDTMLLGFDICKCSKCSNCDITNNSL
ncbi:hypothetical protein L873DRAFT_1151967 [Choiromyces venosus 120613-1]|uniref:Uncharacterized protein n=1 Tax=Choiromyces venosus 120613-1 TaxID=1336337 RepID=A0A3N4JL66_9PEZI|nr:hypothetical protein L873DRAFT_1151967 [Choiromyces venosus 120613-1]